MADLTNAPSELTFDRGDDCAGRAEDVHGVEALVFANDDLQHSQQLPEAFVDGVMQAVVVALYRENVGLIVTGDPLCAELRLVVQQSQVDAKPGAADGLRTVRALHLSLW